MSATHTWVCLLLWTSVSTQNKSPDVSVTCFVSEDCLLPCSFQPDAEVKVEWFRQDEPVLKFEQDDDGGDSSEERVLQDEFDGRVSVVPSLVSRGNATMTLRRSRLKDRGTYRCQVKTSEGEQNNKVILKVEAPIRSLSLELSRMSGYEEMICATNGVYPAPRVSWTTEPPTFEDLRPVTRVHGNKDGLYAVNSRLKLLAGQPNLIYICKVTTSYGGPAWTTSLRAREIKGHQGKDLTVPCLAPPYLNRPALEWNFYNGPDSSHILTYDSRSDHSTFTPPWDKYVELDGFRVPFGDGSLRLMDPMKSKHAGIYTCRFWLQYNTHTEQNDVIIDGPDDEVKPEPREAGKPSYWWVAGLVIAVLALTVVGLLVYLKLKGTTQWKPRNDPEGPTDMNVVEEARPEESFPLNETQNLDPPRPTTQRTQ